MSYMDFFSLVFCKTVDLGQHMIPLVFRKAPPAPLPRRLDLITQRVGGHGIQSTQSRRLTPGRKPPCIRVSLQFHIAPAVSDKPCFGEGTTVKISNACVAPLLILGHSITLAALLVNVIAGLEVRPLDPHRSNSSWRENIRCVRQLCPCCLDSFTCLSGFPPPRVFSASPGLGSPSSRLIGSSSPFLGLLVPFSEPGSFRRVVADRSSDALWSKVPFWPTRPIMLTSRGSAAAYWARPSRSAAGFTMLTSRGGLCVAIGGGRESGGDSSTGALVAERLRACSRRLDESL